MIGFLISTLPILIMLIAGFVHVRSIERELDAWMRTSAVGREEDAEKAFFAQRMNADTVLDFDRRSRRGRNTPESETYLKSRRIMLAMLAGAVLLFAVALALQSTALSQSPIPIVVLVTSYLLGLGSLAYEYSKMQPVRDAYNACIDHAHAREANGEANALQPE